MNADIIDSRVLKIEKTIKTFYRGRRFQDAVFTDKEKPCAERSDKKVRSMDKKCSYGKMKATDNRNQIVRETKG